MVTAGDMLRAEGQRAALLQMLEIKFGTIDSAVRDRVEKGSPDQVISWLRRFVVAKTLDEIFAT